MKGDTEIEFKFVRLRSEGVMYTEAVGDGEVMLIIPFVKYGMYGTYYCASSVGPETIETFVKIQTYSKSN